MRTARTALRLLREGRLGATVGRLAKRAVGIDIPVGDRYYGSKADGYDAARVTSPTWRWEDEVVRMFLEAAPRGLRVLDVPFGTGRFVPMLRSAGCDVVGIDASEEMLTTARATHSEDLDGFDLRVGDSTRLPLPDQDVDVALCFRFLPGIITARQAEQTLKELARVTRDRALLQFKHRSDDAPRRWHGRWSRLGTRSPQQLRALLRTSGWEVESLIEMPGSNRVVYICRPIR